MEKLEKILVLNNEIEAKLLDGMLSERNIPHIIRSYYDSAYDGMWQTQFGWGHLEAPIVWEAEILAIYNEMSGKKKS
jgi:hypothetical protein